jgi:hypothetical protein
MNFKHKRVLQALEGNASLKEQDFHQALLDICYDKWREEGNQSLSYQDITTWARIEFGIFVEFMLLAGKYNQQVCNGGHSQYIFNGYAGTGNNWYEEDGDEPDLTLHFRMCELMDELKFNRTVLGRRIVNIYNAFPKALLKWLNLYKKERYEDDGPLDKLDDIYYAINQEWMNHLNKVAEHAIVDNKSE